MKNIKTLMRILGGIILPLAVFASCDDDVSQIGSSLTEDVLKIEIKTFGIEKPVTSYRADKIDTRSTTCLLGKLDAKGYGKLDCSFVARMMCASRLGLADSITDDMIDGIKLRLAAPRLDVTGDSLMPQSLEVFRLTKQLPTDINNTFDPTGYYDPSAPLGEKTFSLSALGMKDSVFYKQPALGIDIPVGNAQAAREIIAKYKESPETFAWPSTFSQYFPGIYVHQNFGNGCVANISDAQFFIYYHYRKETTEIVDNVAVPKVVMVTDSISPFATAPEVLSSNNITFTPDPALEAMVAGGAPVLVSPAGYNCNLTFPTSTVVQSFFAHGDMLSIVNNLTLTIPAVSVENDYDIAPAPWLLMIKTSEIEDFFANNRLPDSKTSFWAAYDAANEKYVFSSMRDYIIPILEQGKVAAISEPDTEFTLVPVLIQQESYSDGYGNTVTTLVRCVPYISRPTMTLLRPEDAEIKFTYSYQSK